MDVMEAVVARRSKRWARELVLLFGVDIPAEVSIGADFKLEHRGFGTVIMPETVIGDRVTIYHGVTIGRSDVHRPDHARRPVRRVVIEDDVVLCAGAAILCGEPVTTIARGTVVGANAVVTRSTRPFEIWAGNPGRVVGHRDPADLRGSHPVPLALAPVAPATQFPSTRLRPVGAAGTVDSADRAGA